MKQDQVEKDGVKENELNNEKEKKDDHKKQTVTSRVITNTKTTKFKLHHHNVKIHSTESLKREIEDINTTTAPNRDNVPLIRLTTAEEEDEEEVSSVETDNNNNNKINKHDNIKIVAVQFNNNESTRSILFNDGRNNGNIVNESFDETPSKLEENEKSKENTKPNSNKISSVITVLDENKSDNEDGPAVFNYEYLFVDSPKENEPKITYVYFYTDSKTYVNIFENRRIDLQPIFHENRLTNAIILLKTPPTASDTEILLTMFGSGVPLNYDRIKCYIQFKFELLKNFRNSIIDLRNGKYLCLKTIHFGKKNPKHDFRSSIN